MKARTLSVEADFIAILMSSVEGSPAEQLKLGAANKIRIGKEVPLEEVQRG